MQTLTRLQDLVVARLYIKRPEASMVAMACLIARDHAVTVAHVLGDGAIDELTLIAPAPPNVDVSELAQRQHARVVWTDPAADVALLQFPPLSPVSLLQDQDVLSDTVPPSEVRWEARVLRPDEPLGQLVDVAGVIASVGEFLRLRHSEGASPGPGLSGAPVFWDDHVIGLLVGEGAERGELYAVPATTVRRVLQARGGLESPGPEPVAESNAQVETAPESRRTRNAPSKASKTRKKTPSRTQRTESTESAFSEAVADEKFTPEELDRLAVAFRSERPLDEAALFARLSLSSRRALAHADGMRARLRESEVHMEEIILGLYEKKDGPTQREMDRVGVTEAKLRERLSAIREHELPAFGSYEVRTLNKLPPHSPHVREALIAARDKADALGAPEVQSRHLLYGVLSVGHCGAVRWLIDEFHADRERIDMTAPPSRPATAAARPYRRPRFNPDLAEGKELDDLLDIRREVEAISAVVAAADTSPPLSIGLFGDWGTGKSFFMSRMEERIEDLKATARANPKSAYCANIVQLRFNAWHYMDTDLWASLAAEIFEGLARELDKDRKLLQGIDDAGVARARLLAATQHLRDVKTQAEQSKAAADATLRESEQRLASLAREERDLETRLAPAEIAKATFRFVAAQPQAARSLEAAAQRLGIPQAKAVATDTRATLLELKGLWGGVRALALTLRRGSGRFWVLLLATLALLLASVAALVAFKDQLVPVLGAVVTLAASLGAFLKKVIPPTREALKIAGDARAENEKLIERELSRRETELRQAHDAIQQRVAAEESTITRVTREIAELEQQLEALRADRQMESFIETKNKSTDYTKHFGVVARARHDFERLTDLLKLVTEEAGQAAAPAGDTKAGNGAPKRPPVPRIDRIILYIDDLDRCPEEKVVDVLQAVHLLLAFPLFIVVVGVDSRWLLHSLRRHASAFKADDEDGVVAGMDEEERVHWQSTPFNYLEKIFQIPFNLRPMDEGGFKRLIDDLTTSKESRRVHVEAGRSAPAVTNGAGEVRSVPPTTAGGPSTGEPARGGAPAPTPVPASVQQTGGPQAGSGRAPEAPAAPTPPPPAQQPPEPAGGATPPVTVTLPGSRVPRAPVDPNPDFLDVTTSEREFMHRMHRLIPTPRAAKRYVNVYRLLRATLPDEQRTTLEDEAAGRCRCVLLMLAILTGFPQEGTVILRELVQRKPTIGWWDFVEDLALEAIQAAAAAKTAKRRTDAAAGDGDADVEQQQQRAQRWEDLRDRLRVVRRELESESGANPLCAEFADWAKLVARYSFESGRVLGA
ncbi:MAG: P-loop NTPase fold protein [Gemmatimonadaceae bacterium]